MENIIQLIEELEDEFAKGKNFLWSRKSLVNLEKCGDLIIELKRSLPTAIQEASYILTQKEKILRQAKEMADKTLQEAELRAEQLVSESALVKKAENESQEIMANANKRSTQLMNITKENIDRLLKSVEQYLLENLHIVRNNREELNGGLFTNNNKRK